MFGNFQSHAKHLKTIQMWPRFGSSFGYDDAPASAVAPHLGTCQDYSEKEGRLLG